MRAELLQFVGPVMLGLLGLLQLYLHSVAARKLAQLSHRLSRMEQWLGQDQVGEAAVEWTPTGVRSTPTGVMVGQLAPPLALTTAHGTLVTLKALAGQPALLLFLDARCATCHRFLNEVLEYLDTAPAPFLLHPTLVTVSDVVWKPEIEEVGNDGVRVLQGIVPPGDDIVRRYGVTVTPCAVLLDDLGRVEAAAVLASIAELLALHEKSPGTLKSWASDHADTRQFTAL